MGNTINTDKYVGIGFRGIIPSAADPAAQAYFAATGITGVTQQAAINNLVKGLKTDGIWSKMKAVYPFVTDNKNLLSYTEDFSNGYWTKDGVTITAGQTDPTGGSNATRVVGTTPSRSLYGLITLTTGATYTLSCYVKSTSGSNQTFRIYANAGVPFSPDFTATSSWQRVTLTFTAAAGNNSFGVTRDSSTNNYDILVYGIQMELGSTATTYQPIATTQQAFIASQFKFNLVNPVDSDAAFRLVFNGGWTHSSNGATPNGTNGYADTKLVPLSVFSSANSISFGYYSRTIGGAAETRMSMGAFDGASDSSLIIRWNNGFSYSNLNENLYTALYTNADTHGFYVANRNTINREQGWKNGIKMIDVVNTPTTRTNKNVYLGALNNNTAPLYFDNKQSAFAHIADGLTDTEAANLYTRVQAYQTALARQI
jgi:hypothetical protein